MCVCVCVREREREKERERERLPERFLLKQYCCYLLAGVTVQEFAPSDEELLAYRRGEEWDPEKAKAMARLKVIGCLFLLLFNLIYLCTLLRTI